MLPILPIILASLETEEEKQAFELLYHQYESLMFTRANDILRNREDAEDAVQEAFLRIAENFHKINAADCHKQKGFVVVVVENIAKTIYSKRKKEQGRHVPYEDVEYDTTDNSVLEDQVLASMDMEVALQLIKDELSETDREILMMRYIYGLNDHEASRFLKISNDTARKRLERARRKLIHLWKEGAYATA